MYSQYANTILKGKRESTMRVFVSGASGAIGSRLVPQSIACGHEVIDPRAARESVLARAVGLRVRGGRATVCHPEILQREPAAISRGTSTIGLRSIRTTGVGDGSPAGATAAASVLATAARAGSFADPWALAGTPTAVAGPDRRG